MPSALEEKDAIREVLAEYCFRLDDGRFAEMAALFTENGTWDTAFGRATGRTAIAELARGTPHVWIETVGSTRSFTLEQQARLWTWLMNTMGMKQ